MSLTPDNNDSISKYVGKTNRVVPAGNTPTPQTSNAGNARGMKALTAEEFNALDSVGGIRGLIEAVLPGLAYMVLFVVTQELKPALIGSLSIAAILVIVRLIQRTPVTMAFSGVFGVAIGLYVAWKSGNAGNFYVWGLLVNAVYLLAMVVSMAVRWPAVGVIVELMKTGFGLQNATSANSDTNADASAGQLESNGSGGGQDTPAAGSADKSNTQGEEPLFEFPTAWRKNPVLVKAYGVVTWLWCAMFLARLVVQLPLYFLGTDFIAALGTARLIMGVPLFAFVLWLSWRVIRQATLSEDHQR